MIDLVRGHDPFVAFVGAGASALPPSRLPTWTEFNNLLTGGSVRSPRRVQREA
jgi:hypothetical protein